MSSFNQLKNTSSASSTISAEGGSESHSHTTVIITVIVILLTVVLAGIAFGYFRIKRRFVFVSRYVLIELNLSISVSSVSPANSNVTNILTSLNNLIASNEERDSAKHIQEVKREIYKLYNLQSSPYSTLILTSHHSFKWMTLVPVKTELPHRSQLYCFNF